MNQFSDKDPDESIVVSFDFRNVLDVNETIEACTFEVLDKTMKLARADDMLTDDADISEAPIVKQRIANGTDRHNYIVKAKITTSKENIYVDSALMAVRVGA